MMRKKIVFIINSLAGGGAERVMCTLLGALAAEQESHDLHLVLLDREQAAYQAPAWVTVHQLDSRHSMWRSARQLFSLLRQLRPDATLSFLTRANIANILAGRLLRFPALISERVNTSSHLSTGRMASLSRFLVKQLYPLARRIIAVSPGVADDLVAAFGVPRGKIVVIANPIDVARIRADAAAGAPAPAGGPYAMGMGRLVPNKNFAMLIEAFARSGSAERLIIFGEGPERPALEALIARLNLADRVHLAGFSANPFAALGGAALFILPSNAEGFPNSLLEAMSLGVPVISTNCLSGPAEVLADLPREKVGPGVTRAEHGLLVPPNDGASMAEAIRVMADPAVRAAYGAKAVARAEYYGVKRAKDLYWAEVLAVL